MFAVVFVGSGGGDCGVLGSKSVNRGREKCLHVAAVSPLVDHCVVLFGVLVSLSLGFTTTHK